MAEQGYPKPWTEEDYKFWDEYAKFAKAYPLIAQMIHVQVVADIKKGGK